MNAHDHLAMVRQMREKWLWTNATVMMLGLWLVTSPFTFAYASHEALEILTVAPRDG